MYLMSIKESKIKICTFKGKKKSSLKRVKSSAFRVEYFKF